MSRLRIVFNAGASSQPKSVAFASATLTATAVRRGILRNIPNVRVVMGMLGNTIFITKPGLNSHITHSLRLQRQTNNDWQVLETSGYLTTRFGLTVYGMITDERAAQIVAFFFKE